MVKIDLDEDGNTTPRFSRRQSVQIRCRKKRGPIDFILARGPISTLGWKILRDSRNGLYPSDHYFIAAELSFP